MKTETVDESLRGRSDKAEGTSFEDDIELENYTEALYEFLDAERVGTPGMVAIERGIEALAAMVWVEAESSEHMQTLWRGVMKLCRKKRYARGIVRRFRRAQYRAHTSVTVSPEDYDIAYVDDEGVATERVTVGAREDVTDELMSGATFMGRDITDEIEKGET